MISLLITCVLVIGIIGFNGDGDRTGAIVCGVLIGVVWLMHYFTMLDAKAWVNRRNYWSMSGKGRARARMRWEREAEAEEAERRVRPVVTDRELQPERFTCHHCGRDVETTGWYARLDGRMIKRYDCPRCGWEYFTEIDEDEEAQVTGRAVEQRTRNVQRVAEEGQQERTEHAVRAIGGPEKTKMDSLMGTNNLKRREDTIYCPTCGVKLIIEKLDDGVKRNPFKYECPRCRTGIWM